ncbi:uncharacterized protein CDV56_101013 [Aspergillus thermomutatus]|uniref:Uncharacterized protein n=1 Tax=Aspergillus thermomutatus TaxID=41047 RepID=A0A397G0A5_ASPTH|nr:uncharacterized protein CDV56_101013 [Aspergillus thermomutatus]RHZ43489.1 hypothetical protein CDV56_101013 [Aspergillus thermomutatus]
MTLSSKNTVSPWPSEITETSQRGDFDRSWEIPDSGDEAAVQLFKNLRRQKEIPLPRQALDDMDQHQGVQQVPTQAALPQPLSNITPRNQPSDKQYPTERQLVKAEHQPVEAERQPVEAERQPVEAERQPVEAERQLVGWREDVITTRAGSLSLPSMQVVRPALGAHPTLGSRQGGTAEEPICIEESDDDSNSSHKHSPQLKREPSLLQFPGRRSISQSQRRPSDSTSINSRISLLETTRANQQRDTSTHSSERLMPPPPRAGHSYDPAQESMERLLVRLFGNPEWPRGELGIPANGEHRARTNTYLPKPKLEASTRGSSLVRLPSIGTPVGEDESIREDRDHLDDIERRIRAAMENVRVADRYGRLSQRGRHRRLRLRWTKRDLDWLIRKVDENGPEWQLIWELNREGMPVIHPRRTPVDDKDKGMIYKKDQIRRGIPMLTTWRRVPVRERDIQAAAVYRVQNALREGPQFSGMFNLEQIKVRSIQQRIGKSEWPLEEEALVNRLLKASNVEECEVFNDLEPPDNSDDAATDSNVKDHHEQGDTGADNNTEKQLTPGDQGADGDKEK